MIKETWKIDGVIYFQKFYEDKTTDKTIVYEFKPYVELVGFSVLYFFHIDGRQVSCKKDSVILKIIEPVYDEPKKIIETVLDEPKHLLYTDTLDGKQVCKDNLWVVTTDYIKKYYSMVEEIDSKQAKIDSLMLEYCPDKMTQEQKDNWANHQKPFGD